jgi:hypothetical protein
MSCQYGAPFEDSIHYLMECPLYQIERDCLFRNLRKTHKNIETLLFGNESYHNLSMDCPLPTNITHIIMSSNLAHTQM